MLGWATALIVSAVALSLAWLLASIWLVVVAFKRSAAWGLVVLLVPFAAVAFAVPSGQIMLAPGQSTSVEVSMSALRGASGGSQQAVLQVSDGGVVVAQAMLYALIK